MAWENINGKEKSRTRLDSLDENLQRNGGTSFFCVDLVT